MTGPLRFALAVAAGLLAALAFPSPGWWQLAFVAWVPLLVALEGVPPRRGALLGAVAGFVFFLVTLRWLLAMTTWAWVALALYLAIYPAAFGAAAAWLLGSAAGRGPFRRALARAALPAVWVALEWVRSWLTGFGWASAGYSLARAPALIQLASVGGVLLLSLAVLASNVLFAGAWAARERGRSLAGWLAAAIAIPAALALHGLVVLRAPLRATGELRVAVVQGDISPLEKWSDRGIYASVTAYDRLSERAARERPDLIVWPETAIPTPLDEDAPLPIRSGAIRRRIAESWRVPVLFGTPETAPDGMFWNSAVLFPADGARVPPYRKDHLVPFAEYQPLASALSFLPRLVPGPDFIPGGGGPAFAVAGARVGVLICFEDVFPEEAVARAAGADVVAVITNDGFFGPSGLEQHLDIAVLRAVEMRRSIARAANTGVSALIDPRGRVLRRAPAGAGYVIGPVPRSDERTLFSRAPEAVPMLALALALVALALPFADRLTAAGRSR